MSAHPDDGLTVPSPSRAEALDAALGEVDWRELPDGAVRDRIDAPSGSLARVTMGPAEGQRVVLVPGVTGSKEDFLLMMPLLAQAGYRVEAYDMAGQYESAAAGPENLEPPEERYTLKLFTDDLVSVLQSGAVPAHVLGYSFAGTVASVVAAEHPELVATLTLLSSPPDVGQSLRSFKVIGPLSRVLPEWTLGPIFTTALRLNLNRNNPHRALFVRARLELTRPSSVTDVLALIKRTPEVASRLRESGIPMMVATGTGDVWPVSAHRAFAQSLGARCLILRTGHSTGERAPHQLVEAMLGLMSHY